MPPDSAHRSWSLKSFIDSLTVELDRLQDALAVKGVNRRLTYTVKDLALDLQLFPEFDGDELRFSTARPGETGAARISFQLGSITDRQIRESTSDPLTKDDVSIDVVEGIDEKTRKMLQRIGVTSMKDLERVERQNIDLDKVADEPIDYRKLANMVHRARRRSLRPPQVHSASLVQDNGETLIVIEGERFAPVFPVSAAAGRETRYPRAFLDGDEVPVRSASAARLQIRVDEARLSPDGNRLQIALDPYLLLGMNLKP
ncbi:MAG: hypothetical protein ACREOF_06790 [Gemmatimonadales bacterium]